MLVGLTMWFLTVVYTRRHGCLKKTLAVEESWWLLRRAVGCLRELLVAEESCWLSKRLVGCCRELLVSLTMVYTRRHGCLKKTLVVEQSW